MTKTPDQWLEEVSPKERTEGILKLFLGYAPGVGKTYSMLSEAIRRRSRGEDVVIGIIETHGRKGIAELAAQLERVPMRKIEYKGTVFEEMDVDAVIARHPLSRRQWNGWPNFVVSVKLSVGAFPRLTTRQAPQTLAGGRPGHPPPFPSGSTTPA